MKSTKRIILLLVLYLPFVHSFIDLSYFKTLISNLVDERRPEYGNAETSCGSNQLMLQLAENCITSPEKILALLTADSLLESCREILVAVDKANETQRGCNPLPLEHLYMKLFAATRFFYSNVCQNNSNFQIKIAQTQDCLPSLHNEFLECEGPPDWYENEDRIVRCSIFDDIIKCIFEKTTVLCGPETSEAIKAISIELFQMLQPSKSKCEVTKSLPSTSSSQRIHSEAFIIISLFLLFT